MANHFNITNLGDITVFIKDGTHGTHKDVLDGPFLLSAQNVINGEIVINEDDRKISVDDFNAIHRRYKLRNDDVLVSIVGTLGKCALIKDYHSDYTFQRSVAIIRFDTKKILPKFAYYQMLGDDFQRELRRRESKGAQGGVYLGELEKVPLNVPDLETQKKIINILELWDYDIGHIEEIINKTSLKQKWLIRRLICNNTKSSTRKLSTLATIATGKKDVNQGCSTGQYPFFTCAKEHTWSNGYSFDKEAICIAGNGEIGQSFYYSGKFEAYQRTYVLTDFSISGQYLNFVIRSMFKEMVERQKQMSAMPYIKLTTLKDFMVPVPSEQEIANIVDILNNGEKTIKLYQDELSKRKLQKQYLLNHLINGDLDLSKIQLEEKDKSC